MTTATELQYARLVISSIMKIIFSILIFSTLLTGCGMNQATEPDKLQVVASIYPWGFFAEQIGGDLVQVNTLVPVGLEPHEYDPSPDDLKSLYDAEIFISNGAALEPWVEDVQFDLQKDGIEVFTAADYVELITTDGQEEETTPPEQSFIPKASAHETGEDHAEYDPHFWLDPVRVRIVVQSLANKFADLDPENTDVYQANAKVLISELDKIDSAFTNELQTCSKKEFVVSHSAFAYLADRYGLTMIPISGISPEDEPTIKELESISKTMEEHGLSTVYTETLINANFSQTISTETGAQILVLNPIEGLTQANLEAGENYFTIFKENLENLKAGLSCETTP